MLEGVLGNTVKECKVIVMDTKWLIKMRNRVDDNKQPYKTPVLIGWVGEKDHLLLERDIYILER